ncbi:MAG: DUF3095 domain-containing protein [Melioribacteraceae bacterium]|nr:DUF3095 domain-containing protein [Melioribacteraceae bacterium]MCF8265300.1 DUF3095 domain-containing protein [Melioribacteraceae bacterium]
MSHEYFYRDLPVLNKYIDVASVSNYVDLPEDWYVVVSDVTGSTEAITAGRYKEVNILGAALITAVRNETKPLEIPFVFGGDGASLCIPKRFAGAVENILGDVRELASKEYQLDFRVGLVEVSKIYSAGFRVLIAKYQVSENFVQSVFSGGGLEYAEDYLKANFENEFKQKYIRHKPPEVNLEGLECRWSPIESTRGEIISLLVKVTVKDSEKKTAIYREVIEKIYEIYEEKTSHPVNYDQLKMAFAQVKLLPEIKARTHDAAFWARFSYMLKLRFQIIVGYFLMARKISTKATNWGNYKTDLIANSDYRKFDDMVRKVLSGTEEMRNKLENYLHLRFSRGELVYGIHASSSALLTCVVSKYEKDHFHFIDGNDGGYAEAARKMKSQIKQNSKNQ